MKKHLVGTALALLLFGALYLSTKETKRVDYSERSEIATLSKYFLRLINRREYLECQSMMAEALQSSMDVERLKKTFDPILKARGSFSHFRIAVVEKSSIAGKSYRVCKLKGIYEKGPLNFTVLVNGDRKIEGVYVK